jgi:hypothetical protein
MTTRGTYIHNLERLCQEVGHLFDLLSFIGVVTCVDIGLRGDANRGGGLIVVVAV